MSIFLSIDLVSRAFNRFPSRSTELEDELATTVVIRAVQQMSYGDECRGEGDLIGPHLNETLCFERGDEVLDRMLREPLRQ